MAYATKRGKKIHLAYKDAAGRLVREAAPDAIKTLSAGRREADRLELRQWEISKGIAQAGLEPITFRKLAERYLEVEAPTRRSFETIKRRLEMHILPELGPKLAAQILPADIQALLNRKAKEGLAPQTRQHILNHVQKVFTFGVRTLKAVRENPAADVERVHIPEREPKALEPEHVPLIIAHVPDRWRGLFATAVYTGLRKGELLGLRVADVDLERRFIAVSKSYDGETKGAKARGVPIPGGLVPYLKVELGRVRSEFLFPGLDGRMQSRHANLPRTMRNAMKAAGIVLGYEHVCRRCDYLERRADDAVGPCPKCGFSLWPKGVPLDVSFKELRSTCATYSYEATDDIHYVQKLLGHATPGITSKRYAKMREKRMLEQASKLHYGNAMPQSVISGSAHTGLTTDPIKGEGPGVVGEFPEQFQALLAARGRGLEPLTSGVTGQPYTLAMSGHALQPLATVAEVSESELQPLATISHLTQVPTHNQHTALLTVAEVASRLGVHSKTVYLWVRRGELKSVRFGAVVRVPESELTARGGAR